MEKILTFIVDIKSGELLLLNGNDTDLQFHESFWYVVTGSLEPEDDNLTGTVKREVKEETNLDVNKIIDLNWIFEYESLGQHCVEHAYISYVEKNIIILNEENYEYKWCAFNEFINTIKWFYDKEELKRKIAIHLKKD